MARTAVDLPDPQQTPADGGANNADDLLAQLAGEEVDRLLSEAEGNATDPLNVDAERGGNQGNRGEASLSGLFSDLDEAEKSALADVAPALAVAAIATPEPIAATPHSAADALAAEMEEDDRAHAAAVRRLQSPGANAAATPEASALLEPEAVVERSDEATATEAHPEPALTMDDPSGGTRANDGGFEIDDADLEAPTPLLVRVLELMNAPLAGLPDGVRRAVGTVAIVTTVNAIGVLAYVLIFRRHP